MSHIPPCFSLINFFFLSKLIWVIVIFDSFLSNLFIDGGLKKYKSNTIILFLCSSNDLWQVIEVIILLSVILNKHNGNGISFKSFISSTLLLLLLLEFIKSTNFCGTQVSFSLLKHSLTIEIAPVYILL